MGPDLTTDLFGSCSYILLEHGADVNAQNKNGFTPSALAWQGGLAEVIHVLVQHGADSSAYDNAN